jgi:hypothetical protein
MDEFQIVMILWGVVVVALIAAQQYFQYALKKYENTLWESLGKPSAFKVNGLFSSIWYVLSGKYNNSASQEFIKSCQLYRMAMIFFIISAMIVFGFWPATWVT